jgi:hypothetical protein
LTLPGAPSPTPQLGIKSFGRFDTGQHAARFFDRLVDTKSFKRGMDAYNNPSFYRQIGKDPQQLTASALESLATKFVMQGAWGD